MKTEELDEMSAARASLSAIYDPLCELVQECYADIRMDLNKSRRYGQLQKARRLQALMTNLHLAHEWQIRKPSREWFIEDDSGFFHLVNINDGMSFRFNTVDPITRSAPKGGNSLAARARYTQGAGLKKGELSENLIGRPDLSWLKMMIACDYRKLNRPVFMRAYKLMKPGEYGVEGKVAYSFPIAHSGPGSMGFDPFEGFEPDPENGADLLEGLITEEKLLV